MAEKKATGGFSSYVDTTKKANEAKKGLMMKKELHHMTTISGKPAPTMIKVTKGVHTTEPKDSPASQLGWESTAKMIEDADKERTEMRKLKPATVDEVFSK